LVAEWTAAVVGSTFAACSDLNSTATNAVELAFFLGMGFGLVFVWEQISTHLAWEAFMLLLAGGAAYVLGIVFFVLGELKPIYHVIWHLFVLLGATLHWFSVYFFVVNKTLDLPNLIISSIEKAIME
jgi:hemolysin III